MEKRDFIAPAGGVTILAGGLALAFFTATNGAMLQNTKDKTVKKYVAQAQSALAKNDIKNAEKMIKKAIAVDPKNKEALNEFKKIALSGCSATIKNATLQTPKKQTPAQTKPEAEEEDEMGCI